MVQRIDGNQHFPQPRSDYEIRKINKEESIVFSNELNSPSPTEAEPAKPLKAYELDYKVFKKLFKNRSAEANSIATYMLDRVKDSVADFNKDFPQNQFTVDYGTFPKPEEFAQFKKEAFYAWKDAVEEWARDIDQEIKRQKDFNLQNVTQTIDKGFTEFGALLGFTKEYLAEKLDQLGGDINKLNHCLKRTQAAIIANDNRNTETIMNAIVEEAGDLHKSIDSNAENLAEQIVYNRKETRSIVKEEASNIKNHITKEGEETRDAVKTNAQQTQEINALSDAISNAINGLNKDFWNRTSVHYESTIKKVEELKQQIIEDPDLNHEKKIEVLKRLRDLTITDDWITNNDLDKVLEEEKKKITLKPRPNPPNGGAVGWANRMAKP